MNDTSRNHATTGRSMNSERAVIDQDSSHVHLVRDTAPAGPAFAFCGRAIDATDATDDDIARLPFCVPCGLIAWDEVKALEMAYLTPVGVPYGFGVSEAPGVYDGPAFTGPGYRCGLVWTEEEGTQVFLDGAGDMSVQNAAALATALQSLVSKARSIDANAEGATSNGKN